MTSGRAGVLAPLTRSEFAPAPRTLVDIFRSTAAIHGDALAVDTGTQTLTYAELDEAAEELAARLADAGIGLGDKIGVRIKSGTVDLYVAILGVLMAGTAYVPVDADDPDERAGLVFAESAVAGIIGNDLALETTATRAALRAPSSISPDDDAWVIFTSGSTGTPKGVAVTHRNAAAFVDAESRLFLHEQPIGPTDRVMAGLSVAFDASCEEMWLAWRYGGCLVPAPRSLVRSGVDVGPWLVANRITIVSTVPTLVALWPDSSLDAVRLLILGGEACPAELASRLSKPGREVWNTYGPTEATVVACAAMLEGQGQVRIGLPLDGWDLAVVGPDGDPVGVGETGELIIGGVGLARYLDPAKDAEKYGPMPALGWERAYRSGDIVRNDPEGLVFAGRADDQVKLGGRRIELGEVDDQLLRLPGVMSAAAAVRSTASGNRLLVGYVTVGSGYHQSTSLELLRHRLPAALVPRLAVVEALPTRTSGKADRDALPWPLPPTRRAAGGLIGTQAWVASVWYDVLGAEVSAASDDFFDFGGGSLTAAQVVGRLRERFPEVAVGDLYANPTVATLSAALDELGGGVVRTDRRVLPIPFKTQAGQLLALIPLRALAALRWLAWLMIGCDAGRVVRLDWLPTYPWWMAVPAAALLIVPLGRMTLAALLARILLRPVLPGRYPRGGKAHLRLWLALRIQDELAATALAGAPWFLVYARLLGAQIGQGVDLHTIPPVTGWLKIGNDAAVEPEVDLGGFWIDGDAVEIGDIEIGDRARIGVRSMLGPGARVGKDAEVAPGSFVAGRVPAGQDWAGSPAERRAKSARGPWSTTAPPAQSAWLAAYGTTAALIAALPGAALVIAALVVLPAVHGADTLGDAVRAVLPWLPLAVVAGYVVLALLVAALVRFCGRGVEAGHHRVRSGPGLRTWATIRVLDEARTWLFPLYSSALTPAWLRLLGARVGAGVEASTVLMIPKLVHINDHAFLADDTLIGPYELGGGWLRVERVKVGKRAFVGNSGMLAPGRKVPRESLVAVLSAAPRRSAAEKGTSWIGSPPTLLRRASSAGDASRTYDPPRSLRVGRGLVEACRVVPLVLTGALYTAVAVSLLALLESVGVWTVLLGGPVMIAGGVVAAIIAAGAKWLLVGRHRAGEHPLWSSFVWRNELADTFIEMLAAPWFASVTQGTAALNLWMRLLGARIGKGVWCDTYWLPEPDLVELQDGVTVNHGCVVQTHLFHDRVLSMDRVVLRRGATLGPHSVILPAATIGRHATIGPVSLVMRGESVPSRTRWSGNPIGPWEEPA